MSGVRLEIVREERVLATVAADLAQELPREVTIAGEEAPRTLCLQSLTPAGGLQACVACGHPELYPQKAFPRTLGIIIVVVAAVLAPFTWYASLLVAAVLDALLYKLAPDMVVCYVCGARHHGFVADPKHPRFDREIDERLKYGERAVMGKPMLPGGTANAPEPEH